MRNFRRTAICASCVLGAILWGIFVAPTFMERGREVHLGDDCWTAGYRDPVTGQTITSTKDKASAENCLARGGR